MSIEWTTATLKEYFDSQIQSVRDRTSMALESAERAVTKAEIASEKRFDSVNEFRSQLRDQQLLFITRTEAEAALHRNAQDIKEVTDRFNEKHGRSVGLNAGWGYLVNAIGLILMALALLYKR